MEAGEAGSQQGELQLVRLTTGETVPAGRRGVQGRQGSEAPCDWGWSSGGRQGGESMRRVGWREEGYPREATRESSGAAEGVFQDSDDPVEGSRAP